MLPQYRDPTADFIKNDLHILVRKQKWKTLQQKLSILINNSKSPSATSVQQKQQLESMVRQVDENGRTPLSLACGKSSAPPEIIDQFIQAYPHATSIGDKNDNLPLHHFCHSYGRNVDTTSTMSLPTEDVKDEAYSTDIKVLHLLHSACPTGVQHVNSYGNTPLHIYVEHQCANNISQKTLNVALKLLGLNPGAASEPNRGGSLPLHYIVKKTTKSASAVTVTQPNAKALVRTLIKELHKANPEAEKTRNNAGLTPFFVAVIYNASIDIWQELLVRYPRAAKMQNGRGVTPIPAFWNMFVSLKAKTRYLNLSEEQALAEGEIIEKNRVQMSRIESLQDLRTKAPAPIIDFWLKMELMTRAVCYDTISAKLPAGEKWRPLHSISSVEECPCDALKFALQLYRDEACKINKNGELPLHVLVRSGRHNLTARQAENIKSMIGHLVRAHPSGVARLDSKGHLPLHLALRSGKTWNCGIQSLIDPAKTTAKIRDPGTGLFPFMLAAVGNPRPNEEDSRDDVDVGTTGQVDNSFDLERLNTVYQLLTVCPNLVFPHKFIKKGASNKNDLQERSAEILSSLQHKRDQEQDTETTMKMLKLQKLVKRLQQENAMLAAGNSTSSRCAEQYEMVLIDDIPVEEVTGSPKKTKRVTSSGIGKVQKSKLGHRRSLSFFQKKGAIS